jgi:hypothetical protein
VQRDPRVPSRESELTLALKEEARKVVGVIPHAAP